MQPEAGVVGPLLAIAFILGTAIFRSLSERSGQVPASILTNSVANDPTATLAVHCGNSLDAGFSPFQSTRLSRYNAVSRAWGRTCNGAISSRLSVVQRRHARSPRVRSSPT